MSNKTGTKHIRNSIQFNPSNYVAAVIGTLTGVLIGAVVGFVSGGFIGHSSSICPGCVLKFTSVDPSIILGSVMGLFIGGFLGGIFIGAVTIFKIHKKTRNSLILGNENIIGVLLSSLYISIEIAIGMGIGAIIGSLKLPGTGTALGALAGCVLMLFTATLEKSKKQNSIVLGKK